MSDPRHGRDGWVLDDYEWNPSTGAGTYLYERTKPVESVVVVKQQPYLPSHEGWTNPLLYN